ncbi:MAG TPA: hypothetical protein VF755_09520 [Catenuloplanes sp.]|jgi:hypothetical protein
MGKIRLGIFSAVAAVALTAGVQSPAAAASGAWHDLGWYQYHSTCDAEGRRLVNQDRNDDYTRWICTQDSPGYRLRVFQVY